MLSNAVEKWHLKIRANEVDIVNKTEYLSVHVNNRLGRKEHTKAVSTKVSRAIGFIKRAKQIHPLASLKTLYSSITEPFYRCYCSVWGCCGTADIDQLQKLQNRAVRIVTTAALVLQIGHSSGALVGKLFASLLARILDRWSISISFMGLLHST